MWKQVLAILSLSGAYAFAAVSGRFKDLGKVGSVVCVCIGSCYFVVIFVAVCFPQLRNVFRRLRVPEWIKFIVQVAVFASLAWLTDELAEHDPEVFVSAAFFFAGIHVYTTSGAFHLREDYSVVLGLLTVAFAVLIHLWHRRKMVKNGVMIGGGLVLACYWYMKKKRTARREERAARQMESLERVNEELRLDIDRMRVELENEQRMRVALENERTRLALETERDNPGEVRLNVGEVHTRVRSMEFEDYCLLYSPFPVAISFCVRSMPADVETGSAMVLIFVLAVYAYFKAGRRAGGL